MNTPGEIDPIAIGQQQLIAGERQIVDVQPIARGPYVAKHAGRLALFDRSTGGGIILGLVAGLTAGSIYARSGLPELPFIGYNRAGSYDSSPWPKQSQGLEAVRQLQFLGHTASGEPTIDLNKAEELFPSTPPPLVHRDLQSVLSIAFESQPDLDYPDSFVSGFKSKSIITAGHAISNNSCGMGFVWFRSPQFDSAGALVIDGFLDKYRNEWTESADDFDGAIVEANSPAMEAFNALPNLQIESNARETLSVGSPVAILSSQNNYPATTKENKYPPKLVGPAAIDGIFVGLDRNDLQDGYVITGFGDMSGKGQPKSAVGGSSGSAVVSLTNGKVVGINVRGTSNPKTNKPTYESSADVKEDTGFWITKNGKPTYVSVSIFQFIPASLHAVVGNKLINC